MINFFLVKWYAFWGVASKKYGLLLSILLIFLGSFAFYYWNHRYLSKITISVQDIIFGADNVEIVEALEKVTFDRDMRKHILFSATLAPLVAFLQDLLSFSFQRTIRIVFSLLAGLNATGAFFLCGRKSIPYVSRMLFAGLYVVSFSNLVIYSIPETYQLSNLMILLYLAVLFYFYDNRLSFTWQRSLILSSIAGLASLYNYPLISLLGIHLLLMLVQIRFVHWLMIALSNVFLSLSIFFLTNVFIYQWHFLDFFLSYSNQWASLSNFLNPEMITTVLSNFFMFSVVSPIEHLPLVLSWRDVVNYQNNFVAGVLTLIWVGTLFYAVFILVKEYRSRSVELALLAWVMVMTAFYTYFNPVEALLYSSQILLPLILIVSSVLNFSGKLAKVQNMVLVLFCVLLAINNGAALYTGVPGF